MRRVEIYHIPRLTVIPLNLIYRILGTNFPPLNLYFWTPCRTFIHGFRIWTSCLLFSAPSCTLFSSLYLPSPGCQAERTHTGQAMKPSTRLQVQSGGGQSNSRNKIWSLLQWIYNPRMLILQNYEWPKAIPCMLSVLYITSTNNRFTMHYFHI